MRHHIERSSSRAGTEGRDSLLVLFAGVLFCFGLVLAVGAAAQTPPADAEPAATFGETVDVRVVDVEVVVTDREGDRVEGLAAEDFRVTVEGRDVPLAYFSEIRDRRAVSADGDAGVEVGQPVPTHYLVFVDGLFTFGRDRNALAKRVERQLDRLQPGDTMMLVTFDGGFPEMLVRPTDDPQRLRGALEAVKESWDRAAGLRLRRATVEDCVQKESITLGHVSQVVDAMAASMRRFGPAFADGRRVTLWITGGWMLEPHFGFGETVDCTPTFESTGLNRLANPFYGDVRGGTSRATEVDRLVGLANQAGFSIYPVDAPGSQQGARHIDPVLDEPLGGFGSPAGSAAPERGFGGQPTGGLSDPPPLGLSGLNRDLDPRAEAEKHAMLRRVARGTGGLALINSQRNRPVEIVEQDTRNYYWLGFHLPDELRRDVRNPALEIEVEVLRPGADVRARTNTLSLTVERERDLDARSVALFEADAAADPDLKTGLQVATWPGESSGFRKRRMPVEVTIPVDEVAWLPHPEGGGVIRLDVRFLVVDEDGERSEVGREEVQMRGARPPRAGDSIVYEAELLLRKGEQDLVVMVEDPVGDVAFLERLTVDP